MSRAVLRNLTPAWLVLSGMLLALAGPPAAAAAAPEVRPVSDAERRAVELAALYLDRGPAAWWPEIASASPLRELGEETAADEIAVRAGPPGGARWVLQTPAPGSPEGLAVFSIAYPSGIEEHLTLLLAEEAGSWKIQEIRSLADPSDTESYFWDRGAAAPAPPLRPPPQIRPRVGLRLPTRTTVLALAVILFLAAIVLRSTGALRTRPVLRRAIAAGLLPAVGLVSIWSCGPGEEPGEPAAPSAARTEPAGSLQSLADLRELRWALASGAPADRVQALSAQVPAGDDIARVVSLWRAETGLSRVDLGQAEELLASLPDPAPIPLGDLLRARLAYVRGEADRMEEHYEQVAQSGTDHDGLRYEAAQALAGLGRTIEAEVLFTAAAEMGSRMAEVHYSMAAMSTLSYDMETGEEYLARAWSLEPVMREVLFAEPLLAALCARPTLFPVFDFGSPAEPLVPAEGRSERPVELPRGAASDLSGRLLRIDVAGAELLVPAGAELAPEGVRLESAGERRERREERVLARLPELTSDARSGGTMARPRRMREMTEAALALSRQNRWHELARLTEAISDSVEVVPPLLGQIRAVALQRTGNAAEAQRLLVRIARASLDSRRLEPGAMRQLAEMFVASQDYDLALRLMKRAESLSPLAVSDARLRQVRMEKELYEAAEYHRTDHFRVVYPRATGEIYAGDLGLVLEEEMQRISRWIPLEASRRGGAHTVHVYPLVQFLEAYSGGMLVLGIYDGRLSVPFAELRSLHPELVSVLSHELAHAMLARATDDQAPKWLHEGLAQHIEMMPGRINPIPDLRREGRILSFPMIEAILAGFGEPQLVDLAYSEAAWVVHYIEAKHGVRAIRALVDAYAEGMTTEEALREVFGMSVEEFDAAVWDWGVEEAPASWPTQLRRYDQEAGKLVRRATPRPEGRPTQVVGARVTVRAWHSRYASRTLEAKRALSRIVGPVRQGRLPSVETCRTFGEQVDEVLNDPQALSAPLPGLTQHLELAFRSLGDMASSCQAGNAEASRASLRMAEAALSRAATELREYGLSP